MLHKIALFSCLGKLYSLKGDIEKAKNVLNSAKMLVEENFPNHLEAAYIYERLAVLQYYRGKYDDAIENLNKNLKVRLSIVSKDHYKLGYNKIVLGLILCASNRIEESIKSLLEAEAIYDKNLPENHKHFALVYLSINNAYEMKKDYEKALQYLVKTQIVAKKYPEQGLYSIISYHFPATEKFSTLKATGKAIDYYMQALDLTKKIFGKNHIRTTRYYYLLGQAFKNTNKNKAKQYYQKALNIANNQHFDDEILLAENKKNIEIIQKQITAVK